MAGSRLRTPFNQEENSWGVSKAFGKVVEAESRTHVLREARTRQMERQRAGA